MFSNNFVTSLFVNGSVAQEKNNGIVSLPFGSEYQIRLENKHDRRAKAEIYLDDQYVGAIVVESRQKVDLKRFISENRAFLFVRPNSQEARQSGKSNVESDSQGLLQVYWYLENKPVQVFPPKNPWIQEPHPWKQRRPWEEPWMVYGLGAPVSQSTTGGSHDSLTAAASFQANSVLRSANLAQNAQENGVTAKGQSTDQEFQEVSYMFESTYTLHRLVLRGFEASVEDILYCTNCGKKRRGKSNNLDKYCANCGHKH